MPLPQMSHSECFEYSINNATHTNNVAAAVGDVGGNEIKLKTLG